MSTPTEPVQVPLFEALPEPARRDLLRTKLALVWEDAGLLRFVGSLVGLSLSAFWIIGPPVPFWVPAIGAGLIAPVVADVARGVKQTIRAYSDELDERAVRRLSGRVDEEEDA